MHFSLHTRTFVLFWFLTPFLFFPSRVAARVTGCCLGATTGCLAQEVLLSTDNSDSVWVQYARMRSLASTLVACAATQLVLVLNSPAFNKP